MWRYSIAATVALFACAASARAHDGYGLQITAEHQKKGQFSFVFVEGHAHFPQGTQLRVGVRHSNQATYLASMRVTVKEGIFGAEFGPWNQRFTAGKYLAVVEFRMDDQSPEIRALLKGHQDFVRCLHDSDDHEFAEQYERENPERARQIREHLKKFGRCPSEDQKAGKEFWIGSDEEADMARDEEDSFLRDTLDQSGEMLVTLAALWRNDPGADPEALARLEQVPLDWIALETSSRLRRTQVVFTERAAVYDRLSAALLTVFHLHGAVASFATGEGARLRRELEALEGKGEDVSKDERRHRATLREKVAAMRKALASFETDAALGLAEALHGPDGLDPKAARKSAWLKELQDKSGIEISTRE